MIQKKESAALIRLQKEFIDCIDEFSKNDEKWSDFIDFASQINNYDFNEKVCIYLQNPNATYLEKWEKWREYGCVLKINAKRIYLPDGQRSTFFVYDRADIIGTPPKLWQFQESFDINKEFNSLSTKDDIKEFLSKEIHSQVPSFRENLTPKLTEVIIDLLEMRYNFIIEGQHDTSLAGLNIVDIIKIGKAATLVVNNINDRFEKIIKEKGKQNDTEIQQRDRGRTGVDIWESEARKEPVGLDNRKSAGSVGGEGRGLRLEGRGDTLDKVYLRTPLQSVCGNDTERDIGRGGLQGTGTALGDMEQLSLSIYQKPAKGGGLFGKGEDNETSDVVRKGDSGQRSDLSKPTNREPNTARQMEWPSKANVESGSPIDSVRGEIQRTKILKEDVPNKKDTSSFLLREDVSEHLNKQKTISNFVLPPDAEIPKGKKEKFSRNVLAIGVIKSLQNEKRLATYEEQKILSQYSGWGGISEAFDKNNDSWKSEYSKLKSLLTDSEYEAARASTLNAHYTSPIIVKAIYKALENFGFKGGHILEPSMATGVFFSAMPQELQETSKLHGVELDILTGEIAKNLYQQADIQVKGFEQTDYEDNFFDVVVGNVPFGEYRISDSKHKALVHDFFFLRALDKVKSGGIVALLTSTGTLDKQNPSIRKKLAARADLIGAIRLPDNIFGQTANTKITTDIIFLQKRSEPQESEPDWVYTGIYNSPICTNAIINQYFIDNPSNMLGDLQMESSRFGKLVPTLKGRSYEFDNLLNGAVDKLKASISDTLASERNDIDRGYLSPDESVKNYTFTLVNKKIYYRENSVLIPYEGTSKSKIEILCRIRENVRDVINSQTSSDFVQATFDKALENLNISYDLFYKKFGEINLKANSSVFAQDSDVYLLCSLEKMEVNEDTGEKSYSKGDIFFKKTIKRKEKTVIFENPVDALNVAIAEKGFVDLDYIESICTKTKQEIIEEIEPYIFIKPPEYGENIVETSFCSKEEYLCGNVKKKLAQAIELAKNDNRFEKHVIALKAVQPKKLTASDINVRLSSHWIKAKYVNQFMYETLEVPGYMRGDWSSGIAAKYSKISNEWDISNKSSYRGISVTKAFGTSRISAFNLIELTLNQKSVTIKDAVDDSDEKIKYVYNHEETIAARQKQTLINEKFKDWIFKDPVRRGELVDRYNELFNSVVPRNFDGSYIQLKHATPEINLRPHQLNAISRIRQGNNTLLAHVVGSGKTFTMIAGGMEQLRLGTANKLMYVVPNHLISDFAIEFLRLYPTANVLVTTEKDFEKKNRQKFVSRIVTSDIDAVVMGHSQYEKIAVSPQRKEIEIRRELENLNSAISSLRSETTQRVSVKQLESKKAKLKEKLKELLDSSKKDQQIFFEELGVDSLFVDEAHNFKNGAIFSKMQNVGGVSNANSLKASDMLAKCRYISEIKGSLTFATGTPISNAISELYIMQRYLQEDTLSSSGINHFDEWISVFGETSTSTELKPEGTGYRTVAKISNYFNVPELMSMFSEIADIQTAEMLELPTPKIVGGAAMVVACEPSDELMDFMDESVYRAERIRSGDVKPEEDNMLKLTNDARKAGTDIRLYYPNAQFDICGKISKCCDNVLRHYHETSNVKGTQLIFSDIGTPNKAKFNVYDEIKRILIEKGIPQSEIVFIHDYKTQSQKQSLYADMRIGIKRVLIGSTQKCGAGTNIQDRLVALHHVDCPYRPSDIEQREGRILRQGNLFKEVSIYRYVTKKSFDAYLWQLVEKKQQFISQIMSGKAHLRSCDEIDEISLSYAEVKTIATGNPLIKEKTELETELNKFNILKKQFQREVYESEEKLSTIMPQLKKNEMKRLDNLQKDMELYMKNDVFRITLEGEIFNERAKAGERLLELVHRPLSYKDIAEIGEYNGFKVGCRYTKEAFENDVTTLFLFKNETYKTTLSASGIGNIIKIENLFNDVPFELKKSEARIEEIRKQEKQLANIVKGDFQHNEKMLSISTRLVEINIEIDKMATATTVQRNYVEKLKCDVAMER